MIQTKVDDEKTTKTVMQGFYEFSFSEFVVKLQKYEQISTNQFESDKPKHYI